MNQLNIRSHDGLQLSTNHESSAKADISAHGPRSEVSYRDMLCYIEIYASCMKHRPNDIHQLVRGLKPLIYFITSVTVLAQTDPNGPLKAKVLNIHFWHEASPG